MKYFFILSIILSGTKFKNSSSKNVQFKDLYGEKIACINSMQEKAVIIFLNGYNFSILKALQMSNFIEKAEKRGYSIVIPEVKKTVYAKINYPETADFLSSQKKLNYFVDTLIGKFIDENYKGRPIFIYGLSTGARGSLLIAEEAKDKIEAIALLSGDYDQTINVKDNLMVAAFGQYEQNNKRWQEIENPYFKLQQLMCSVYIYHSKADKIVPFEHSKQLNSKLIKLKIENNFEVETNQSHDFESWNSKTDNILDYFDEKIEK